MGGNRARNLTIDTRWQDIETENSKGSQGGGAIFLYKAKVEVCQDKVSCTIEQISSGSCAPDEVKPVTFIHRSVHLSEFYLLCCMFRYVWKVSEWSECSSPCNGGNQTRTSQCRGFLVDVQVNSSLCNGEKPESEQVCNVEPCPAEWIVGNWSQVRSLINMGNIPDISKSKYLEKLKIIFF